MSVNGCSFTNSEGGNYGVVGFSGNGANDSVAVTGCTFAGSSGAAIRASYGTTVISGCEITEGTLLCAVIEQYGTMTIDGSTISNNSYGGICNSAADNGGTMTVVDSTIVGNGQNENTYQGGGIDNGSWGTLTVDDSTICGNDSWGGGGGGIYSGTYGTVTLNNTIVANNYSNDASSPDIYGTVAASYCLIKSTSGASFSPTTNITNQDPLLASLGDYGGPIMPDGSQMQTSPPLAGSPAIDAGSYSAVPGVTNDRRGAGYPRVVGTAEDIGACEYNPAALAAPALVSPGNSARPGPRSAGPARRSIGTQWPMPPDTCSRYRT